MDPQLGINIFSPNKNIATEADHLITSEGEEEDKIISLDLSEEVDRKDSEIIHIDQLGSFEITRKASEHTSPQQLELEKNSAGMFPTKVSTFATSKLENKPELQIEEEKKDKKSLSVSANSSRYYSLESK